MKPLILKSSQSAIIVNDDGTIEYRFNNTKKKPVTDSMIIIASIEKILDQMEYINVEE